MTDWAKRPDLAIRLSNWGDRSLLLPVRRYLEAPLEGDLYEMLSWPTYHVHAVWERLPGPEGPDPRKHARILAYGTLALCADGMAEATEMVTLPEARRHGLASMLRMVQARDLEALGFPMLCQAAKTEAGQAWCATHLTRVGTLPDGSPYYRGSVQQIRVRLSERGVPPARPFTSAMLDTTRQKATRAWAHLKLLHDVAEIQRAKVALRSA